MREYYHTTHAKPYPTILSGVEISCADRMHVVIIFDDNNSLQKNEIIRWINEYVMSEEDGTYETSISVMSHFRALGCFCYIAHINTTNLFNKEKNMAGVYKTKLKQEGMLNVVGANNLSAINNLNTVFERNGINKPCYLIDNDAHDIQQIGENYFWIKTGQIQFESVYEALHDFDVSVAYSNDRTGKKYIAALYIEASENGFLQSKNHEKSHDPVILRFSNSLNCFIGGRGTGKSSLLDLLEFVLGSRVKDTEKLDFICKHGTVYVLFVDEDEEYLVRVFLPKVDEGENILKKFGQNPADRYHFNYSFSERSIKEYILQKYLSIYHVVKQDEKLIFKEIAKQQKKTILSNCYNGRYAINDLVNIASGDRIDEFIKKTLFGFDSIPSVRFYKKNKKIDFIKSIKVFQNQLIERNNSIHNIIDPFNEYEENRIQICYEQHFNHIPYFESWNYETIGEGITNELITIENVAQYLYYVLDHVGIVRFIEMVYCPRERDYSLSINPFAKKELSRNDEEELINKVFDVLKKPENNAKMIDWLDNASNNIEKFHLKFNVTSFEGGGNKPLFIDIKNLSLGQKVVAMLDLILGHGKYIGDYRPILLDQPEDNLDSQYIYKNLVKELRTVKNTRQIIIATHNATIVTNAMTDQVCFMKSDGKHGWVEHIGYPSDKTIKKDIVNTLEGGIESFNHKAYVYERVL